MKYAKYMSKIAAFLCFGSLILIVAYIFLRGAVHLKPELFAVKYNSQNASMLPSIVTTIYLVGLSLLIAVPLGIFAGIYLVEYSKTESKLSKIIMVAADSLAGIPSIIFGLFGMLFFVQTLSLKKSLVSGALTVSLMILPIIIRSTQDALLRVRNDYRMGSLALGAGRLRTVFRVILPCAMPGILSGIILSTGRILGETAALVYTLGTSTKLPSGIFKSGRTLSVHMYILSGEGKYVNEAFATSVILLLLVIVLNSISSLIARKIGGTNK